MEEVINQQVKDFSKKTDIIQTAIILLLALLIPTFLGQLIQNTFGKGSIIAINSQIIIGSIVNTCLIISAMNLKGWTKILGVVTMPSISTILSGFIFNSASSMYMIYMIPAIWLGNFTFVYAFKFLMVHKKNSYFFAGIVGIITKVFVIFCGFLLLSSITNIPEIIEKNLQNAMSLNQLITATIGTIISFFIYKIETK